MAPTTTKATAAPDSMLPVGLAPLVNRFREAITGGGKRRRDEEKAAAEAAKNAVGEDPIEDADDDEESGTYLTLATVDWARFKPLILQLDEDDRAALAHANSSTADVSVAKAAAAAAGGGSQYVARVEAEGAAGGQQGVAVAGAPAGPWRGGAEDEDDEDDEDAGRGKRATRGSRRAPSPEGGSDDSDDDLDFRLSEAGWPGASIVGAHKRDGATAIRVSWDDGEERWVDSGRLHDRQHTLVALVQFYESKAKNKG
jgi:hypothetical protein